jgi:Ca-activated chloride channel family protein
MGWRSPAVPTRRGLIGLGAGLLAQPVLARPVLAQPKKQDGMPPGLSASREVMAGAPLSIAVERPPAGARIAIARPDDPDDRAILVVVLPRASRAVLPTPGLAGAYELRVTADRDGKPVVQARRPLVATAPSATVSGPATARRGNSLPIRGIGPNGEQDRVVLVRKDAPAGAQTPFFYPAENVENTLEAPDEPGEYEIRYVMNAPLAENVILARQPVTVD